MTVFGGGKMRRIGGINGTGTIYAMKQREIMMPYTHFVPLATLIGAYIRFREN